MRNHLQGSSVALDWQLSESTDCVLIALVPPGSNRWLPQGVCSGNVCEGRCCTYPKCTPSPPTAMSVLLLLSSLNTYSAPDNVLRHWGHRAFALQELTASPGRQTLVTELGEGIMAARSFVMGRPYLVWEFKEESQERGIKLRPEGWEGVIRVK